MPMRAWWVCIDCDAGGESEDVAVNDKAAERHVKDTRHTTMTHLSTACG
jgi:hypothetical protein